MRRSSPKRRVVMAVIALGVLALASSLFEGRLRQMLQLTTADPSLIPSRALSSMAEQEFTLTAPDIRDVRGIVQARNSITFRVPAAFVRGYGGNWRASGEQGITFAFWSRSLDPVGPTYAESARICRGTTATRETCPQSPVWARLDSGEWEVQYEIWNSVSTPARRQALYLGPLQKAKSGADSCQISEDHLLQMTVITIPESDYPPATAMLSEMPTLCGGAFSAIGRILKPRGEQAFYVPPRVFYRLNDDATENFSINCQAFSASRRSSCTGGFPFGVWWGRLVSPSDRTHEWNAAFENVITFLNKHVIHRTI